MVSGRRVKRQLLCFLIIPLVLGFQAAIQFTIFWALYEPHRGMVPHPDDPMLIVNMIDEMWMSLTFGSILAVVGMVLFFYIIRSWRKK
jgi:hypothetical protein